MLQRFVGIGLQRDPAHSVMGKGAAVILPAEGARNLEGFLGSLAALWHAGARAKGRLNSGDIAAGGWRRALGAAGLARGIEAGENSG